MASAADASAFDAAPVGLLLANRRGGVSDVNQEWLAISGLSKAGSLGEGWLQALRPAERVEMAAQLQSAHASSESVEAQHQLAGPNRDGRFVQVRARRTAGGLILAVVDITKHKAREGELTYEATHDPLTGLLNRAQFAEHVRHALTRLARRPGTVAVLFIDLDHFKAVNDRFGHGYADRVLVAKTESLQRALRPSDIIARVGGDEFVVLCEELHSEDEAKLIAERIVETSMEPLYPQGEAVRVGCSLGLAFAEGPNDTAESLLQRADHALYQAKERGRGRYDLCAATNVSRWLFPGETGAPRGRGQND